MSKSTTSLTELTGSGVDVDADVIPVYDQSAGTTKKISVRELVARTSSVTQSGTGALTRTVSATLAAITRTGDYNTTANFNTATVALTETIGVSGIQTGQTAESVAKALWTHRWVTSGQPPFEIHNVSAPNTGGGAGTYNHAVFFGYNVGRHSTGAVTANKPALIMGMEDNYYDDGGDNTYGSEWYVEHYSSDGTTVPLLRPFYTRVRNANNTDSSCTTLFNIGTDGTGQFDVRAGVTTSLLNIVPTAFTVGTSKGVAFKVTGSASPNANYIQITAGASGGGASIAAVGETDVAMALSSKGTGGIVFYTNSFNDAQVQVLPTAGATRNLRLTGSNGGNPTISVSAGNLAITPAIVAASSITTGTPSGGTSGAWKFGVAAVVSPTSPNRTIELDVGGTIYYLHAKTTNN